MHGFDDAPRTPDASPASGPWYSELTKYHWFVLMVAALGWLFDTMDQQLFVLARGPALTELLTVNGVAPLSTQVAEYNGFVTSIFLIGWATGGLGFGILGDRIGRAKTMMLTILIYSAFTGLSALSWNILSFSVFRFLTGLGVGGEFAVGVALVAEVMPDRARPFALGLLQALSAIGNITAALIFISLGVLEHEGHVGHDTQFGSPWRIMFVIGTLPALLAVLIRRRLKEPERWQAATSEGILAKRAGSYAELFGTPRWRKNAIVGLTMAFAGVVGLWGIGFYSIDLNRSVLTRTFQDDARRKGEAEKDREFVRLAVSSPDLLADLKPAVQPAQLLSLTPEEKDPEALWAALLKLRADKRTVSPAAVLAEAEKTKPQPPDAQQRRNAYLEAPVDAKTSGVDALTVHATRIKKRTDETNGRLAFWGGMTSIMINLGAFFGIYAFSYATHFTGRRIAFAISFVLAMLSTALVFWKLSEFSQIFWMVPLMGFCQLSLFGGYAIYFPEIFPTHLRSTGTSFCYNVGRFVAATGPTTAGLLIKYVFLTGSDIERTRHAGIAMCGVFLIGLLALPFAPETKGRPLPE